MNKSIFLKILLLAIIYLSGIFFVTKNYTTEYLIFAGILFLTNIFIIINSYKNILKNKINSIYNSVSFLDSDIFSLKKKSRDIKSLVKNIEKYTERKKREVELLNDRENFRREFIGNLAHELKTPLFTIQSYIYLVINQIKDLKIDNQTIEKHLKKAYNSLDGLVNLVNRMDTISNIETGKYTLNLEDINILDVIDNVFEELEIIATKNKITLGYDRFYSNPIKVIIDKEKIKQVLYNIISNSIYYGNQKGKAIVSILDFDDKIKISVEDDGLGIDKSNLPRIFERFYRVEKSRSRNTGGAGLGMSIVKHIMYLHGENINIDSTLGKGTKVSFTLKKSQ